MAQIAVWLKHPKTGYVVLVTHDDTRDRCLSEGWTPAPDPRTTPISEPVSAAEPTHEPATAPADVSPPPAQPSVAATPSIPAALADMSVIGDSPEELAQALEDAAAGKVRERNTAARTAFGIPTPPQPTQRVKPAKAGQQKPGGGRYAG